ncbi:MAG: glycosyltransferase family 1 protein [Desulfosarcinaceae bacterium]|nr:glycosyltransferase family 1 protein [Desulfosarcinaceae bacterium]
MIHVAMDAKRFFRNTSGLGRYSRTLVNALLAPDFDDQLRLTLFKPPGECAFAPPRSARVATITAQQRLGGDLGNALWRFHRLPKLLDQGDYGLFHGPSHVLPNCTTCPMVVTMLDLIFLRYPQYFRTWDRNYYRYIFRKSAQRADHIISISQATKRDLVDRFDIPEEKITVIYPAFDDVFIPLKPARLAKIRQTYHLPEIYLLYVGTIEPRKNILRTAQAFDRLLADGRIPPESVFLIVGSKGWFYKEILRGIAALRHQERIRLTGPIYEMDLAGVYQLATAMAYPSEFEGFGYPVLEAMRLGTPVLTGKVSSLPEAGGKAAILVDPTSVEEIANGIERLLTDADLRRRCIDRGYRHADRFSPRSMAAQTLSVYRRFSR